MGVAWRCMACLRCCCWRRSVLVVVPGSKQRRGYGAALLLTCAGCLLCFAWNGCCHAFVHHDLRTRPFNARWTTLLITAESGFSSRLAGCPGAGLLPARPARVACAGWVVAALERTTRPLAGLCRRELSAGRVHWRTAGHRHRGDGRADGPCSQSPTRACLASSIGTYGRCYCWVRAPLPCIETSQLLNMRRNPCTPRRKPRCWCAATHAVTRAALGSAAGHREYKRGDERAPARR